MISPADLMKRVGVGGRLVPFFKSVCVYFVAGCGATPSATAVAAKCAPILCLLLVVLLHHGSAITPQGRYARRVACGLALSALGDALLVWPQHFVAGMAAFAAAHVAYIAAFELRADAAALAALCYLPTAHYLTLLRPAGALRLLVPLYAALLATMAWRATAAAAAAARAPASRRRRAAAAAAGAVLFLLSDALLGYSLFAGPVPYKQVLVMSTYYLGQLGIALSVLETPAAATAAAGR
ncbi:lysoplasmalogenase-like protein TMEM86A [Galleria mellonella]|uniref:lysoplasmalogenase n=1 Tax=Galleria mellonella TaxID=7137 RepID=A0A6J1WKX1_GALME|nr:lysoplasmalogenase-like protein TMEM86A [Galleria mellonella]